MVISCSLLVPMIDSLLTERIFPYVNLNDFTFTQTYVPFYCILIVEKDILMIACSKGFIAGTNNPVLKDSCPYDLLVDIETNSFYIPERNPKENPPTKRRHKLKAIGRNLLEETTKLFQSG